MKLGQRLLASVLIVVMFVSLVACGNKTANISEGSDDDLTYLVTTNSMEPTFFIGDELHYEQVDPAELKRGDIIVYWTVINGERVMNAHRIVSISQIHENSLAFTTQGDNNIAPDSQYVHQKDVLGKVVEVHSKNENKFLKNNK